MDTTSLLCNCNIGFNQTIFVLINVKVYPQQDACKTYAF